MYLLQNVFAHIRFRCVCLACQIYRPGPWQGWESERRATMLNCYWNFSGPWRPREIKWSWDAGNFFFFIKWRVDGFKAEAFHCGEDRSDGLQPILTILLKVTPSHRWWSHRTQRRVRWNHQMSHHMAALQYQRKILFFYHICSPKIISCFSLNHHCVKGLCYISPCPTVKCPAKVKSIKVVRKRPVG